jgi:peptidyl-prolyl cis-trans isomerase C
LRRQPEAALAALSDPHPGGTRVEGLSAVEIERQFGKALAPRLAELPVGRWQGPLASSLGLHLVRIRERQPQAPDYAAVRDRAQRDYLLDQRAVQTQLALDRLKARYGIAMGGKP